MVAAPERDVLEIDEICVRKSPSQSVTGYRLSGSG